MAVAVLSGFAGLIYLTHGAMGPLWTSIATGAVALTAAALASRSPRVFDQVTSLGVLPMLAGIVIYAWTGSSDLAVRAVLYTGVVMGGQLIGMKSPVWDPGLRA